MQNKTLTESGIIYGKIPPQAIDMEKAVLGAVMMEKTALGRIEGVLLPSMFYVDAHMRIFDAFLQLSKKGRPIDVLEVVEQLKSMGQLELIGGPYTITYLTNIVVNGANIEYHAQKIIEMWRRREVIKIAGEMMAMAYNDEKTSDDCISYNEKMLTELLSKGEDDRITHINNVLVDVWNDTNDQMKKRAELEEQGLEAGVITGISSGFKELNKVTNGWEDESLIILAARPAMGKTALALNIARNAAKNDFRNVNVGLFSMEMSTRQLVQRMISCESEVFLENIKKGKLSEKYHRQMYEKGLSPLSETGIYLDDTQSLTVSQLKSKARKMKRLYNVGLIIIDYLQLMSGESGYKGNREQEISTISRNLKGLAKELRLPIIALSQLSRAVESREDKKPKLSDLRESGAIEQDADIVMFLYRPEYYGKSVDENGDMNNGLAVVSIAKNRSGETTDVNLKADLSIQKFSDWNGVVPDVPGSWKKIEKSDMSPF